MQSRYYDPAIGRFINADSYVSTGQGVIGYNMFSYCNNNPVRYVDNDGRMADNYAGEAGELIGELIYEWFTGDDHPNHQTRMVNEQITSEQIKHIGNGAKYLWDAYQRGYAIQQEKKLMEAQMMVDGAITAYNVLDETAVIDAAVSGYHTVQAARAFKKSATYFAAPIPTVVDEAFSFGYLMKGFYHSVKAILEETK